MTAASPRTSHGAVSATATVGAGGSPTAGLGEGQADAVRIAADRLRRGHSGPLTDPEVRRLAGALQRRGFDMADIRAVLRQMATESAALAPDEG